MNDSLNQPQNSAQQQSGAEPAVNRNQQHETGPGQQPLL